MKQNVITFVVTWLETIAVIGFLLFPLMGLIGGWGAGGFLGGIIGAFVATIFGVMVFGALFLLIQNNQVLKDIRTLLQAKSGV